MPGKEKSVLLFYLASSSITNRSRCQKISGRVKQLAQSCNIEADVAYYASQVTNYTAEVINFVSLLTLDDSSKANFDSQVAHFGA